MYLYDIILITEDNIAGQLLASMIFIRMPAKDVKTVGDLTNQMWNKQKKNVSSIKYEHCLHCDKKDIL